MSLKDAFNEGSNGGYSAAMANDFVLKVCDGSSYIRYDFLSRIMTTRTGASDGGVHAIPFAQLDREVLECFRQILIEKGGKPPELSFNPSSALPHDIPVTKPIFQKPGSTIPRP